MTKGEQTRKKIVEAAAPIFNQRGYEGSSLNELMQATGLKKGGIYRHFSSKEELAAEAFDYTWEAARSARSMHVDDKADGIEKLKQIIASFIEHRSPVPGGCPILNTAVDSDDGNSMLRAKVAKALRSWLARLQATVRQAQERGEARQDIDAKSLATLIVASLEGALMISQDIDAKSLATLIVASLEGALMISRIQRSDDAFRRVQAHLNRYLDDHVAASQQAARPFALDDSI